MRFRLSALADLVADRLAEVRVGLAIEGSICPLEVSQVGRIDTVLEGIVLCGDLLIHELFANHTGPVVEMGHSIDGFHRETESIRTVANGEFERGVNVSLFVVTSNVEVGGAVSLVGQTVDEERVRVEVEDDGPVGRKDRVKLVVSQTVRVVLVAGQLEQVDDIDESNLDVGQVLSQKRGRCEGFLGDDITARSHDDIGFFVRTGACPFPDTETLGAMGDGRVHVEVLEMRLLVSDDDVDIVGALQAVVHDLGKRISSIPLRSRPSTNRSQTIRIRGKVDPRHVL